MAEENVAAADVQAQLADERADAQINAGPEPAAAAAADDADGEVTAGGEAEQREEMEQDEEVDQPDGVTRLTESEIEEQVSAYLKLPPIKNDEGYAVAFGKDGGANNHRRHATTNYTLTVYCGRNLGRNALPGTDGRCGPDNGPQCPSCKRLQRGPGRIDIMSRKFPGLPREAFVGALRARGGMMQVAITYLREDLGAKDCEVRSRLALLPPALQNRQQGAAEAARPPPEDPNADPVLAAFEAVLRGGRRTEVADPGEDLIANLMETFQIERDVADVALRRNRNDLEQSAAWIVDATPEDIETAVREREEEVASQEGELKLLQRHQAEEVRRALEAAVPPEVLDLADEVNISVSDEASWVKREDGTAVTEGQHFMAPVREEPPSEEEETVVMHCFHCAATLPSGTYRCDVCQLCEGCVLHPVALVCPRLPNGGHLHPHALTYDQDKARRGTSCDIRIGSSGNCQRHLNTWTCAECDFDTCYECIKIPKPEGFDRRAGTVVAEEDTSTNEAENEGIFPTFDAALSERGAAARWEGNYVEEAEVGLVVGTGAVGSTGPFPEPQGDRAPYTAGNRRGGRLVRRSGNFHRNPTLITQSKLSDEAAFALRRFKDPKRFGAENNDVVAAADITQAETILQKLQAVDDNATSRAVCEAVASGRLDLGGALLLSEAFAPIEPKTYAEDDDNENQDEEASNKMTCLCCHEAINLKTAPDGAVGCLSGHPMHASCAADLLLGGRKCPACDISLFYANVPPTEANNAAKMAAQELSRIKEKEMEERKLQRSGTTAFEKGDIVKISSDVDLCAKIQVQNPLSGGWNDDMTAWCGTEFCVVDIEEDEASGRIQARPLLRASHCLAPIRRHGHLCNRCSMIAPSTQTGNKKCKLCSLCQRCCLKSLGLCDSGGNIFSWNPSLVTLLRPAGSMPVGDEACVDEEELVAKEAKNHLIRLRAELAAVKRARENTKNLLPPRPTTITRDLTAQSEEAILFVSNKISPADWYRARHLMLLARHWGDSEEAKARRAQLYALVKDGSLDSVARFVRRYNAAQAIETFKWADAAAATHECVVKPSAAVQLYVFPTISAPRTGFSLTPKTRFFSKKEIVDSDGVMWLQVSDKSFSNQTALQGDVVYDGENPSEIVGARVTRGQDWGYGYQDGGIGTIGTIVAAKKAGCVVVEWDGSSRLYNYAASANNRQLAYAPATPPPQGWFCFRPSGPGSPTVATLARSPFRCYSCGDGIVCPRAASGSFKPAEKIVAGDRLYVAATLEPVKAEKVTSDRVYCSFQHEDDSVAQEDLIWYRAEDLLTRYEDVTKSAIDSSDDVVVVQGRPRTRRELVLLFDGDVAKAKAAWDETVNEAGHVLVDDDPRFASCARGHLLHARCLQGALLSGQSCPAKGCSEPLFLPQIKIQQDESTCCSAHDDNDVAEVEALQAAAVLTDHSTAIGVDENQANEHEFNSAGITGLKMCPSCCAGPLLNKECSDMQAHHGQCTAYALGGGGREIGPCTPGGVFQVPASQIIAETVKLADGQSVADVLPKCPTHNVIVMFNGCMACGYLFTDTDWGEMPRWDPKAKALLELDKKKRKAAMLLAEQIRMETNMLEFERNALWKLQEDERYVSGNEGVMKKKRIEPPDAPAVPAYQVNLHEPKNSVSTSNEHDALARLFFGEDEGDY